VQSNPMPPLVGLTLCALLATLPASVHARTTPEEYEGRYQDRPDSTLVIAMRPRDHALFAVINDARYPLRAVRPDVYLDPTGSEVRFVRDDDGRVIGYRVGSAAAVTQSPLHRLLDASVRLPKNAWQARPLDAPADYVYAPPPDENDGLVVASLPSGSQLRDKLTALTNAIYHDQFPNLHSVLLYLHGALVFEHYFSEYDRGTRHQLRSATKTLMALLAGAAVDRGLIPSLDAPVLPYFSEYRNLQNVDDNKRAISIRDLLAMQSGLACDDHDDASPGNETRMYKSDDWARFVLNLPMAAAPGAHASYCSGNVILVGRIIEKVSHQSIRNFTQSVLFAPLGIDDFAWDFRPDHSHADNFAQAWLRPRDMVKIGVLILNHGVWRGHQVISKAWIDQMTRKQSEIGETPYGFFWWKRYINLPTGRLETPQASGNGGQKIVILRDQDAVLVLTGGNYNNESATNDIIARYIAPALVQ
jgi:CubicO group peptidase (beta-lactamase class C family)